MEMKLKDGKSRSSCFGVWTSMFVGISRDTAISNIPATIRHIDAFVIFYRGAVPQ